MPEKNKLWRPSRLRIALLQLAAAASFAHAAMADQSMLASPLTTESTIGDLLDHPALAGFAEKTLPWAGRDYDRDAALSGIATLLPYHSQVDPQVVTDGLNRLVSSANSGDRVFYEIYAEEERLAQPDLNETGLFFLRGEPGAPFALIAPGGGFSYVGSVHEGLPYADEISRRGYNAFVIVYRTGQGGRVATRDMARALGFIFGRAEELGVAMEGYSLWGSSAGARMAASIGSHGAETYGGPAIPKPAAVIMAYTAHDDHSSEEPPAFVIVGGRDGISPAQRMEERLDQLRTLGVEVEYRRYDDLGHGFGTGRGTSADGWVDDAVQFWERFMGRPK